MLDIYMSRVLCYYVTCHPFENSAIICLGCSAICETCNKNDIFSDCESCDRCQKVTWVELSNIFASFGMRSYVKLAISINLSAKKDALETPVMNAAHTPTIDASLRRLFSFLWNLRRELVQGWAQVFFFQCDKCCNSSSDKFDTKIKIAQFSDHDKKRKLIPALLKSAPNLLIPRSVKIHFTFQSIAPLQAKDMISKQQ